MDSNTLQIISNIVALLLGGGLFGAWLTYLINRRKVLAAERVSDHKIAKELRDELLEKLDACEGKHKQLVKENETLMEKVLMLEVGDQRKTVALSLLMNEVSRLDPTSDILIRAKAVLELSISASTPVDVKKALGRLDGLEGTVK